ncbi:hypothetical protein HDU96_000746 [Phlyctochytrium bullatum]|nr:hypothetical protein HDU96_000746 [Phlyctochytrium bullatum]
MSGRNAVAKNQRNSGRRARRTVTVFTSQSPDASVESFADPTPMAYDVNCSVGIRHSTSQSTLVDTDTPPLSRTPDPELDAHATQNVASVQPPFHQSLRPRGSSETLVAAAMPPPEDVARVLPPVGELEWGGRQEIGDAMGWQLGPHSTPSRSSEATFEACGMVKLTAMEFLDWLGETLSPYDMTQFLDLLRQWHQREITTDQLAGRVRLLFARYDNPLLLDRFRMFLPREARRLAFPDDPSETASNVSRTQNLPATDIGSQGIPEHGDMDLHAEGYAYNAYASPPRPVYPHPHPPPQYRIHALPHHVRNSLSPGYGAYSSDASASATPPLESDAAPPFFHRPSSVSPSEPEGIFAPIAPSPRGRHGVVAPSGLPGARRRGAAAGRRRRGVRIGAAAASPSGLGRTKITAAERRRGRDGSESASATPTDSAPADSAVRDPAILSPASQPLLPAPIESVLPAPPPGPVEVSVATAIAAEAAAAGMVLAVEAVAPAAEPSTVDRQGWELSDGVVVDVTSDEDSDEGEVAEWHPPMVPAMPDVFKEFGTPVRKSGGAARRGAVILRKVKEPEYLEEFKQVAWQRFSADDDADRFQRLVLLLYDFETATTPPQFWFNDAHSRIAHIFEHHPDLFHTMQYLLRTHHREIRRLAVPGFDPVGKLPAKHRVGASQMLAETESAHQTMLDVEENGADENHGWWRKVWGWGKRGTKGSEPASSTSASTSSRGADESKPESKKSSRSFLAAWLTSRSRTSSTEEESSEASSLLSSEPLSASGYGTRIARRASPVPASVTPAVGRALRGDAHVAVTILGDDHTTEPTGVCSVSPAVIVHTPTSMTRATETEPLLGVVSAAPLARAAVPALVQPPAGQMRHRSKAVLGMAVLVTTFGFVASVVYVLDLCLGSGACDRPLLQPSTPLIPGDFFTAIWSRNTAPVTDSAASNAF